MSAYLYFGTPILDKGVLGTLTREEIQTLVVWMYESFSPLKNFWDSSLYFVRKLLGKLVAQSEKREILGIKTIRKNFSWFGIFSPLTWFWLFLERFHSECPLKAKCRKIPSEVQVILSKLEPTAHLTFGSLAPEMEYLSIFPMFRRKIFPSRRACLLS